MPAPRILPFALVALVLVLGGCSSDTGGLRLVETKSPVQLLRNEAWFRLPTLVVKGDSETIDESVACDDTGMERYWHSSTTALMNNSFAPRTFTVAKSLVTSFTDQGWEVSEVTEGGTAEYSLTKPGSVAAMTVVAKERTDESRASIAVTITGPCVLTDGADSDEVRMLEGRS